jgi:drug/metabolite transporter (DMT)-like permease
MREGHGAWLLFGLNHIWMPLFAALMLPFVYAPVVLELRSYALPLLGAAGFYLLGQLALFWAMRWTQASRVSPLLGLKIIILALLATFFLDEVVTPWQWAAVLLSVIAAVGLNWSGGKVPWPGLAIILAACLAYCLTDISIIKLIQVVAPERRFSNMALATALAYVVCAPVGLLVTFRQPREKRTAAHFRLALPVSFFWFFSILAMYACFGLIGVVFGNVVQAMRGPASIFLGILVAHLGLVHLEVKVGAWAMVKRIISALMMVVAIAIFSAERRRTQAPPPGAVEKTSGASYNAASRRRPAPSEVNLAHRPKRRLR